MTRQEQAERRRRIAEYMRTPGTTHADAMREFQVSNTVVRRALIEDGVILPKHQRKGDLYTIIADLLNTKFTLSQTAAENRVSRQCVSSIYRNCLHAGIRVPIRTKGGRVIDGQSKTEKDAGVDG